MQNVLFTSLVGSQAHGVATPESDFDYVGCFVATRQELGGFDWKTDKESWSDASPDGDDHLYHEIRKWLRLAARSNPNVVEPLFSHQISTSSFEGSEALRVSQSLLSTDPVRNAFIGMIQSQMQGYFERGDGPKTIQAALYKSNMAINLLREGTTSIRIEDTQLYYELPLMSDDDIFSILNNKIFEIRNCPSVLPSKPNWDLAIEFLDYIRTKY